MKWVEVVERSWRNSLPLPQRSFEAWIFVKENPGWKKKKKDVFTSNEFEGKLQYRFSAVIYMPNELLHRSQPYNLLSQLCKGLVFETPWWSEYSTFVHDPWYKEKAKALFSVPFVISEDRFLFLFRTNIQIFYALSCVAFQVNACKKATTIWQLLLMQ